MALSTCPHCKGRFFELKLVEPSGSRFKQNFIQCTGCGAPFGVQGYYDVGSLLKDQENEIEKLQKQMNGVMAGLHTVNSNLQVLERLIKKM